jgi:hypothetical protein
MKMLGLLLLLMIASGCGNEGDVEEGAEGFNYTGFAKRFPAVKLPYSLSDTGLQKNRDTAALRDPQFLKWISDSLKRKMFGKTTGIRWVPLARIESEGKETYFITKGIAGSQKAALLTVFDNENAYGASIPFLVPDRDPASSQVSAIDRQFSISKNTVSKLKYDVLIEGKDVFIYNSALKNFTLIITDELNEEEDELYNPIDTFSRKHRFAGDYGTERNNIVSVRDGRSDKEISFFVHLEKEDGECIAELKGSAFFTSSTMAVYRQGGDHCVLQLRFSGSSVSLREEQGCGSHRGLNCPFEGSYAKKKAPKSGSKKPARK